MCTLLFPSYQHTIYQIMCSEVSTLFSEIKQHSELLFNLKPLKIGKNIICGFSDILNF